MGKYIFFLIAILFSSLVACASRSSDAGESAVSAEAISSEDGRALRRDLVALGQAMAVADGAAVDETCDATCAQAETNRLFLSVITNAEKVAPNVWRMMVWQQYVEAVERTMVPFTLFFLSVVLAVATRGVRRDGADMDVPVGWMLPGVFLIGFGIWSLRRASGVAEQVLNPDLYALRDLVALMFHPELLP